MAIIHQALSSQPDSASLLPEIEPVRVLIVDDESSIRTLIREALESEGYRTFAAAHGREALEMMSACSFDIVLTDLMMPVMDGRELVGILLHRHPDVPVVILTGYGDIRSAQELMDIGASDFVMKPFRLAELPIVIARNLRRKQRESRRALEYNILIQRTYNITLDALLSLLEARDTETEGHSERVTAFTIVLASILGIDSACYPAIERGALLHDVGKVGIPDAILHKPGPLTPEEWQEMKKHPLIGYEMVSRIEFLRDSTPIILSHHEHYNGKGYPHGLKGDRIPLEARIFAVADALDTITSNRPYRHARSLAEAISEIKRCRGEQFDPKVVDAFLSIPESHWKHIRDHVKG